jgi:hypothetical protein
VDWSLNSVVDVCAEMVFTEASFQPSRSVAFKVRRNKIALCELRDVKMLPRQASGIKIFCIFSVIESQIYGYTDIQIYTVHGENRRFLKYGRQYIQQIYALKIFYMSV